MSGKNSVTGLHGHTGYWLNQIRQLVHHSFADKLEGRGITIPQWNLLIVLCTGEASTPQEVSRLIGVDPGAVTRLIDRLEAKGFVRRKADPDDRRATRLELTAAGQALAPELSELADRNDYEFFSSLTAAEHRQFRELLAKLLRAREIDPPPAWVENGPQRPKGKKRS